jgi:phosphatidate cytidylyltransferase
MLRQRIITALILIPIVVALLFYLPSPAFCILTALITLGGAWEWSNLIEIKKVSGRLLYLLLTACVFLMTFRLPVSELFIFLCTFVWWLFATLLIILYPRFSRWWSNSLLWRGLMGLWVLVPCWVAINYIRNQSDGIYALLYLFVLIWGADSAAYFAGKKWGKNKLAPRVSPGKSVQGLYGAISFTILIAILVFWLSHIPVQTWLWGIVLSLSTVLFSMVGDLFESMLKRQAGLKDSGQLLPGHGGLLDRIDSLTAAAPIFTLGAILLGMYLS